MVGGPGEPDGIGADKRRYPEPGMMPLPGSGEEPVPMLIVRLGCIRMVPLGPGVTRGFEVFRDSADGASFRS